MIEYDMTIENDVLCWLHLYLVMPVFDICNKKLIDFFVNKKSRDANVKRNRKHGNGKTNGSRALYFK